MTTEETMNAFNNDRLMQNWEWNYGLPDELRPGSSIIQFKKRYKIMFFFPVIGIRKVSDLVLAPSTFFISCIDVCIYNVSMWRDLSETQCILAKPELSVKLSLSTNKLFKKYFTCSISVELANKQQTTSGRRSSF